METDGVIAEITSENFVECIGGSIEEIIKNNEKNHEKKMMRKDQKKTEEAKNIKMNELINIKTIGTHTYVCIGSLIVFPLNRA